MFIRYLAPILAELSRNAYDRRIPKKMVKSYFSGMRIRFAGSFAPPTPAQYCVLI